MYTTITELVVMPLAQGAFGYEWREKKVSGISNTELPRDGRSKMPIGI